MTTTTRTVDAEPVRRHIRTLMAAGIAYSRTASAAGLHPSVVSHILYGQPPKPAARKVRATTAAKILAIRPEHVTTGRIPATGSQRRIQALMATGWPQLHLGPRIDVHPRYVTAILRTDSVYATTAHAIATVYNELWDKDPMRHGISQQAANRVRNYARTMSWAPPAAWDDIDNPDAHPEWTGHCGTNRGWWEHQKNNIPGCQRCDTAHAAWRDAHQHLTGRERFAARSRAKAQAGNRGAAIAEDARELMRLGLERTHIADRLGITKDRLENELRRHPQGAAA